MRQNLVFKAIDFPTTFCNGKYYKDRLRFSTKYPESRSKGTEHCSTVSNERNDIDSIDKLLRLSISCEF